MNQLLTLYDKLGCLPSFEVPPYRHTIELSQTIEVGPGEIFDGQYQRYRGERGSPLGKGSQEEGLPPLFRVHPGATIKRVILDFPASDGIHLYGSPDHWTIVEDCHWLNVGEDALTLHGKSPAGSRFRVLNSSFFQAEDKVIQVNAVASHLQVADCYAWDIGKFCRGRFTQVEIYDTVVIGGSLLTLDDPKGRGTLIRCSCYGSRHAYSAKNGAQISTKSGLTHPWWARF